TEPAVENQRLESMFGEAADDAVEVLGPSGEDEAVPALLDGIGDVVADGPCAAVVFDEFSEDRLDVHAVFGGLVVGLVDDEVKSPKRGPRMALHAMADGAAMHLHEGLETIAAVGSGSQADPAPDRDLAHDALEGHGRHVVALVDDDQPVDGGELSEII